MQMQQHHSCSVTVKRGDIVWVRVQFPHRWWPALVLGCDTLGLFVSFFNFNRNISPRYFLESEVVPFEDAFRSLMAHHSNANRYYKCDAFYGLLDSALRLLGHRVVSSLTCRCQMPWKKNKGSEIFDGSSSLEPIRLLGFVLEVAVLPWVDEEDFVDAVRVVAEVQAFRGYCCVNQKRVYKETTKRGDNVKLHPSSSLGEKMHSVTQESVGLEPKDEYQIISKQADKNLAIGATRRLNSKIPASEGNSDPFLKNQLLVIPETQTNNREAELRKGISFDLHSSALYPFYMVGESLKSEKQSLLRFKNISDQGIVDVCFRNCSTMSKNYFSVPCNSKTNLSNYVNGRKGSALETTIYLTRKRRRLDQPALCNCSFMQQRILSFSSIDEAFAPLPLIKSGKKKDNSDVSVSSSALANCFSNCTGMEIDLYKASLLHSSTKLKAQNLSSNQGLNVTCTCGNSWMNLLFSEACSMPFLKDASCHFFPQIGRVQEGEGNADISKYARPSMSHIKMLEPEESSQKDNQACIHIYETAMNFTEEVRKADLKKNLNLTLQQSVTCESSSTFLVLGTHPNNCAVDANAAKIKGTLGSDSSGDCLVENKDLYQCVAPHTICNSKAGQRSKAHVSCASSTFLHMKFPENFNLPSKGEIIKKFSVFGSVDYSKTKVDFYTGSAQVAFFQEVDAVAAYLYAKRKKVCFGKANVRFWLDPFEHQSRGSKRFFLMSSSASKPVGPPLKSCLKNSNSLRKENRKKHYKVRFTIET